MVEGNAMDYVTKNVSELRAIDNNSEFILQGIVDSVSEIAVIIDIAAYYCLRCRHVQYVSQTSEYYKEPDECPKSEGGCGRYRAQTKFILDTNRSKYVDQQEIKLKGIKNKKCKISCVVDPVNINRIKVGAIIKVLGKYTSRIKGKKAKKFEMYFEIYDVVD